MRSWIFLVLLLVARTGVSLAQSPAIVQLAGEASTQRLKTNLYFLASDQLEGRLMASHGDTLASQLVADGFRQAHLLAPYDKGTNYFQAMTAIRSDVVKDVFSIDGKSYGRWDGWVGIHLGNCVSRFYQLHSSLLDMMFICFDSQFS